jgi:hypothetical protein
MITYTWEFLELYASDNKLIAVRYLLSGTDGTVTVQSEGRHTFSNGLVNKPLEQIVESDIIQWIEKDTTQGDVNPIKLAIENQINNLKTAEKVDFPWLTGTFTIE